MANIVNVEIFDFDNSTRSRIIKINYDLISEVEIIGDEFIITMNNKNIYRVLPKANTEQIILELYNDLIKS